MTRLRSAPLVLTLAAVVGSLLVAARARLGAVVGALSSHNGVHIGDPGAVVWAMAFASLATACSWVLSRS